MPVSHRKSLSLPSAFLPVVCSSIHSKFFNVCPRPQSIGAKVLVAGEAHMNKGNPSFASAFVKILTPGSLRRRVSGYEGGTRRLDDVAGSKEGSTMP